MTSVLVIVLIVAAIAAAMFVLFRGTRTSTKPTAHEAVTLSKDEVKNLIEKAKANATKSFVAPFKNKIRPADLAKMAVLPASGKVRYRNYPKGRMIVAQLVDIKKKGSKLVAVLQNSRRRQFRRPMTALVA